jgi:hypothetical protein
VKRTLRGRVAGAEQSGSQQCALAPPGSRMDCTSFTQVVLPGTATTFTDSGLAARTTYMYRVRAHGALGDSPYSSAASARTSR